MASAHLSALSVVLFALLLVLSNTPADAQADSALDCCLKFSNKSIPKQIVHSYKKQIRDDGCSVDAVVFTTRRNKKLCAPPASSAEWVEELTRFIDNRFKKCKVLKFKGKRCEGLGTNL